MLLQLGESQEACVEVLAQLGYFAIASEDGISVSIDLYLGEVHPRTQIVKPLPEVGAI